MKTTLSLMLTLLIYSEGKKIRKGKNKLDTITEVNITTEVKVTSAKMTKEEFIIKYNVTKKEIDSWDAYLKVFRKYYSDVEAGIMKRSKYIEDKLNHIDKWNKEYAQGLHHFNIGVNLFTLKSEEETTHLRMKNHLRSNKIVSRKFRSQTVRAERSSKRYPERVDWREKGITSPVKYQNTTCASCYAFTVTDTLEAQYNKKFGKKLLLSTQMLVDCSDEVNYGCDGGYLEDTFEFIIKRGGIIEDKRYRYKAKAGKCRTFKNASFYSLKEFVELDPGDEIMLMKAVADVGPIAVGIDASLQTFLDYNYGIYDDPKCGEHGLDHTAVVVGYGTEKGLDYWIVKNSWSKFWGENGYIKIRRNLGNICGIASRAMYPVL